MANMLYRPRAVGVRPRLGIDEGVCSTVFAQPWGSFPTMQRHLNCLLMCKLLESDASNPRPLEKAFAKLPCSLDVDSIQRSRGSAVGPGGIAVCLSQQEYVIAQEVARAGQAPPVYVAVKSSADITEVCNDIVGQRGAAGFHYGFAKLSEDLPVHLLWDLVLQGRTLVFTGFSGGASVAAILAATLMMKLDNDPSLKPYVANLQFVGFGSLPFSNQHIAEGLHALFPDKFVFYFLKEDPVPMLYELFLDCMKTALYEQATTQTPDDSVSADADLMYCKQLIEGLFKGEVPHALAESLSGSGSILQQFLSNAFSTSIDRVKTLLLERFETDPDHSFFGTMHIVTEDTDAAEDIHLLVKAYRRLNEMADQLRGLGNGHEAFNRAILSHTVDHYFHNIVTQRIAHFGYEKAHDAFPPALPVTDFPGLWTESSAAPDPLPVNSAVYHVKWRVNLNHASVRVFILLRAGPVISIARKAYIQTPTRASDMLQVDRTNSVGSDLLSLLVHGDLPGLELAPGSQLIILTDFGDVRIRLDHVPPADQSIPVYGTRIAGLDLQALYQQVWLAALFSGRNNPILSHISAVLDAADGEGPHVRTRDRERLLGYAREVEAAEQRGALGALRCLLANRRLFPRADRFWESLQAQLRKVTGAAPAPAPELMDASALEALHASFTRNSDDARVLQCEQQASSTLTELAMCLCSSYYQVETRTTSSLLALVKAGALVGGMMFPLALAFPAANGALVASVLLRTLAGGAAAGSVDLAQRLYSANVADLQAAYKQMLLFLAVQVVKLDVDDKQDSPYALEEAIHAYVAQQWPAYAGGDAAAPPPGDASSAEVHGYGECDVAAMTALLDAVEGSLYKTLTAKSKELVAKQVCCACNHYLMRAVLMRVVRLGVVGATKAGKSSLLHCLFGAPSNPSSSERTWDLCVYGLGSKLEVFDFPHADSCLSDLQGALRQNQHLLDVVVVMTRAETHGDLPEALCGAITALRDALAQRWGGAGQQLPLLLCFNQVDEMFKDNLRSGDRRAARRTWRLWCERVRALTARLGLEPSQVAATCLVPERVESLTRGDPIAFLNTFLDSTPHPAAAAGAAAAAAAAAAGAGGAAMQLPVSRTLSTLAPRTSNGSGGGSGGGGGAAVGSASGLPAGARAHSVPVMSSGGGGFSLAVDGAAAVLPVLGAAGVYDIIVKNMLQGMFGLEEMDVVEIKVAGSRIEL